MSKLYFPILFLFFTAFCKAQDINFSQYQEIPILRNPSLAGVFNGDVRLIGGYRNQWITVPVNYQTAAGSVEFKKNVGLASYWSFGFQFTNDAAGDGRLGKSQFLPVVAYHQLLSETYNLYISGGVMGGLVSQRFDPTRLRFGDQFVDGAYSATNPTNATFSNTSVNYGDIALGLSLSGEGGYYNYKYNIGASYFHFNDPKVAFSALNDIRLNRKLALNGTIAFATAEDYDDRLVFTGDYFSQGGNRMFQGGVLFRKMIFEVNNEENEAVTFGVLYRWNDAVVPLFKYQYESWTIGMSYDVNVSKLARASRTVGAFELTLSYKNFFNIYNAERNGTGCVLTDPETGVRKGRTLGYRNKRRWR
jgi:type IX secretion system PorP/SprF family membrane protein